MSQQEGVLTAQRSVGRQPFVWRTLQRGQQSCSERDQQKRPSFFFQLVSIIKSLKCTESERSSAVFRAPEFTTERVTFKRIICNKVKEKCFLIARKEENNGPIKLFFFCNVGGSDNENSALGANFLKRLGSIFTMATSAPSPFSPLRHSSLRSGILCV